MADAKTLKMKFKLHQFEFELEGTPEDVKEQYQDIKSFITNDLIPKVNFADRQAPLPTLQRGAMKELPPAQEVEHEEVSETPSLKQIKLQDLAKTETDWLLVYCYFASAHGTKEFTRDDITQLYKDSERHTRERSKNLTNNVKSISKAEYIKATNNTHFILLPKGKQRVAEIFAGHAKAAPAKSRPSSKSNGRKDTETAKGATKAISKGASKKFDFELDRTLNLRPEGKVGLKEFSQKYVMDSSPKCIAVIVHYLTSILKMDKVTGDHVYTALEELGGKIPPSLKQIIVNTKGRRYGWLDYETMDDIRLSIQGKNALKDELLKK